MTITEADMNGRGAWTTYGKANKSIYYVFNPPQPLDGSNPSGAIPELWVESVRYGIVAIKRLLNEQGNDLPLTPKWNREAHDAAVEFQIRAELPSDGYVGPLTMEWLLRPTMLSIAAEHKVHPRWLYGFCKSESGFDPGAQGWENPPDSGLAQFNVEATAVTKEEAYRPRRALTLLARRWKHSLDKYESEDRRLTLDCAIAQHRSPAAADKWFATGRGTGSIVEYVATVRSNSQEW
jgi:hypothetical protein